MSNRSRIAVTAVILAVLVIGGAGGAFFYSKPPAQTELTMAQRSVVPAIEVQCGSEILLQVDENDVRGQRLVSLRDDVLRTLRDAHINWANPPIVRDDSIEVKLREAGDLEIALAALRELSQPVVSRTAANGQPGLDVNDAGGGFIRLAPTDAAMAEYMQRAIDQSIPIIERRIKELGLAEPAVRREGSDRFVMQVPGLGDPRALIDLIGRTAKLEFRLVDTSMDPQKALQGRPPADSTVLYQRSGDERIPILVYNEALLDGSTLIDAQPSFDQRSREPVVNFKFNGSGTRRFARATQENVGRPFAIVLDNEVISAPVIREPIVGGSGQISGNFTARSANDLAVLLRAGALPARLTVIEQRVVGTGRAKG
jgi:preprotein translocase subunit SecD